MEDDRPRPVWGREEMERSFLAAASDKLKSPVTTLGLALQRLDAVQSEGEREKFTKMALRGQRELELAVGELLAMVREETQAYESEKTKEEQQ